MIIHNSPEANLRKTAVRTVNQDYGKPSFTIDGRLFTVTNVTATPLTGYKGPQLDFGVNIEVNVISHFNNGRPRKGVYSYGTFLSCNNQGTTTEFFGSAGDGRGVAGCELVDKFCRKIAADMVGL